MEIGYFEKRTGFSCFTIYESANLQIKYGHHSKMLYSTYLEVQLKYFSKQ